MSLFTRILTSKRVPAPVVGAVITMANSAVYAQTSGGLARAQTGLNTLLSSLKIIVPIVAVIALILIGLLYAADMIRKETMWNWAVGIVVADSAAELVAMLF